jgi:hypothetical protein
MTTLTYGYKTIGLIECGCCRETHRLLLTKESDGDLDLEFFEQKNSFLYDLKERFAKQYLKHVGPLLIYMSTIKELISLLEAEGYVAEKGQLSSQLEVLYVPKEDFIEFGPTSGKKVHSEIILTNQEANVLLYNLKDIIASHSF